MAVDFGVIDLTPDGDVTSYSPPIALVSEFRTLHDTARDVLVSTMEVIPNSSARAPIDVLRRTNERPGAQRSILKAKTTTDSIEIPKNTTVYVDIKDTDKMHIPFFQYSDKKKYLQLDNQGKSVREVVQKSVKLENIANIRGASDRSGDVTLEYDMYSDHPNVTFIDKVRARFSGFFTGPTLEDYHAVALHGFLQETVNISVRQGLRSRVVTLPVGFEMVMPLHGGKIKFVGGRPIRWAALPPGYNEIRPPPPGTGGLPEPAPGTAEIPLPPMPEVPTHPIEITPSAPDVSPVPAMPEVPTHPIEITPPPPAVEPVPSAVEPSVESVPSAVEPSVAPVPSTVEPSFAPVPSALEPSATPVPSTVEPSVAPVPSALEPSATPVPSTVEPSLAPVPSVLEPSVLEPSAAPVPSAVEPSVASVPSAVEPSVAPVSASPAPSIPGSPPPEPSATDLAPSFMGIETVPSNIPTTLPVRGTQVIRTRGDGWCFYRAVLKALEANPESDKRDASHIEAQKFAEDIAKWLKDNKGSYERLFNNNFERGRSMIMVEGVPKNMKFDEYTDLLPQEHSQLPGFPKIWPEVDLGVGAAASTLKNVSIAAYQKSNNGRTYELIDVYPITNSQKVIYLHNVNGNHFDVLNPQAIGAEPPPPVPMSEETTQIGTITPTFTQDVIHSLSIFIGETQGVDSEQIVPILNGYQPLQMMLQRVQQTFPNGEFVLRLPRRDSPRNFTVTPVADTTPHENIHITFSTPSAISYDFVLIPPAVAPPPPMPAVIQRIMEPESIERSVSSTEPITNSIPSVEPSVEPTVEPSVTPAPTPSAPKPISVRNVVAKDAPFRMEPNKEMLRYTTILKKPVVIAKSAPFRMEPNIEMKPYYKLVSS